MSPWKTRDELWQEADELGMSLDEGAQYVRDELDAQEHAALAAAFRASMLEAGEVPLCGASPSGRH